MKKHKVLFIVLGILVLLIITLIVSYILLLKPVSKTNEEVLFTVKSGEKKTDIVSNLADAHLIKSKSATLIYILTSGNSNIQAGTYSFSRNMSTQDIIKSLHNGDIRVDPDLVTKITFKEGTTVKNYLEQISKETNLLYKDIEKEINDRTILKELVSEYWFLDETILDEDIYYPLEGYLFPETYEVYRDTSLKGILKKMLDVTSKKIEPLRKDIENSKYSFHDLLTIASIAEKEANTYDERTKVVQVINSRLKINMSLGMDVTSYYGYRKELNANLSSKEITAMLADNNPYNTRLTSFIGLPIGPICNPGIDSIKAALNPASTDYLYFYADPKGEVHFTKDYDEFQSFKVLYR